MKNDLQQAIAKALQACYPHTPPAHHLACIPTEEKFEGDYTVTTFALAKAYKEPPATVATKLGDYLVQHNPWIAAYQVLNGFLNLTLSDEGWTQMVAASAQALQRQPAADNKEHIVVEFSQPNTNKPLHLGHLRNNFLGTALSNILSEVGHEVTRVNILNDRGIHICKSMVAYQRFGEGKTPASAKMKGDHFVGHYYVRFEEAYQQEVKRLVEQSVEREQAKKEAPIMREAHHMLTRWEAGDPEVLSLWKKMHEWVLAGFAKTYERTHTLFDRVYYESQTYLLGKKVVREGIAKDLFHKKADGSVWIDLQQQGLGEKLLLRGNGTSVYITQDMGAIDQRYEELNFDRHIYVVGNEQRHHFQTLFAIIEKLQRPYTKKLYHLSYGMVDLPSGKMKSREGTAVDADPLLDDMVAAVRKATHALGKVEDFTPAAAAALYELLGVAAVKYFLLRVNPQKGLLFDPTQSIDLQGHTASFVQYTYARIATMLRKANWTSQVATCTPPWKTAEKRLITCLASYPKSLHNAAASYNPSLLADYVYHLAKTYNHFYAALPIARADDVSIRDKRLYLSALTGKTIKKVMTLLGIQVPERM